MNRKQIEKFSFLYRSLRKGGVDEILSEFLRIDNKFCLPLSLSHGVDMDNSYLPMDILDCEPVHWAYNRSIYKRSEGIKNAILIPHPWAIVIKDQDVIEGAGTLIIGPPPSEYNDRKLYEIIKDKITPRTSILLKQRGDESTNKSYSFWESKGLNVECAGERDRGFYYRLFNILNSYQTVIGCTFSSALIFSATLNKKIEVINEYSYRSVIDSRYESIENINSEKQKKFFNDFEKSEIIEREKLCKKILGFEFLNDQGRIREQLLNEISLVKLPGFKYRSSFVLVRLRLEIACIFRKSGIFDKSIRLFLKRKIKYLFSKEVYRMLIVNEISILRNGVNSSNFKIESIEGHTRKDIRVGEGL